MQVELEIRRDGESPRRLLLGAGVSHLGRAPDNDIVLPDVGVSRRHARIVVRPHNAFLEDLGSGNGTFVTGHRISRHSLRDGDQVVIDPFVLLLHLRQDGAQSAVEEDETALVDQVKLASSATAPSHRQARLVVLTGHGLAASYPLEKDSVSMGRTEDRDIVLKDPAASRMQAEIRQADDIYWLRDFGSANGTFINGRRVRERPLQHGDRIRVGNTEFRFELQELDADANSAAVPAAAAAAPAAAAPAAAIPPSAEPPDSAAPTAPSPTIIPAPTQLPSAPTANPTGSGRRLAGILIGIGIAFFILFVSVSGLGLAAWWHLAGPGSNHQDKAPTTQTTDARPSIPPGTVKPLPDEAQAHTHVEQANPTNSTKPTNPTVPDTPEPAIHETADNPMAQGMALFKKGSYLDAMAIFYRAVKADPTNIEAERMCYVSCEFLAIQQLREDVLARQVSPEERVALYQNAVRLGRRAARGRSDLDTAEQAIIAALKWYPQDATLTQLQTSVQARRARGNGTGSRSSARSTGSGGRRSSSRSISASDRRLARQYLDEGLQAVEDGRFVVARDRLSRALGLDSSLSSARSNLADVNRVLNDRARSAFAQGRALEAAGNRAAAIAAYQLVVSYASSSQLSIRLQAQKRIDALQ